MGVKYLWDIIDDARTIETLDCLRGKTISVDLSIWIVEAIKTLQFKSGILKPHLRNIFFRALFLRRLGVKLIFVTEGDAPDLKQDTMQRRAAAQYGVKIKSKGKMGRSRFQRTIDECTKMLDLIGLPHVRAHGEAEAMCAVLNKHNIADGCLTDDGDFFLYGGQTIYRDFGINPKDQHVLVYTMKTIKERTGVNRHDMIGLALINGCDYTSGVPGVGKKTVKKFLEDKDFSEDLLIRFQKWTDEDFTSSSSSCSESELTIRRKAHNGDATFPNDKIIDEFLVQKDNLDNIRSKMKWSYPSIKDLQSFLLKHLEWPEDYTLPKILQLATSTYLEKLSDDTFFPVPIEPKRIVKTKCQMGVSLVDIEWEKYSDNNTTYSRKWDNCPESFITLENQQVVSRKLTKLVTDYNEIKESKKKGTTKKTKTKQHDKENITSSVVPSQPTQLDHRKKHNTEKPLEPLRAGQPPNTKAASVVKTKVGATRKTFEKEDTTTKYTKDDDDSENSSSDDLDDVVTMLPSLTERLAKMRLASSKGSSTSYGVLPRFQRTEDVGNSKAIDSTENDSHHLPRFERVGDADLPEPPDKEMFGTVESGSRVSPCFKLIDDDVFSRVDCNLGNAEKSLDQVDLMVDDEDFDIELGNVDISSTTSSECQTDFNAHLRKVSTPSVRANDKYMFQKYSTSPSLNKFHTPFKTDFTAHSQNISTPSVCIDTKSTRPSNNKETNREDFAKTPGVGTEYTGRLEGDSFFSPGGDNVLIEAFEIHDQHHQEFNRDKDIIEEYDTGLLKRTPPCFDLITPPVSIVSDEKKTSTTSSCLKDITNFSDLGDSILIHDDDVGSTPLHGNEAINFHGDGDDVIGFEKALRRRLNMTTNKDGNTDVENHFETSIDFDDSVLNEDIQDVAQANSPLCLADRLKRKLRR